MKKALIMLLVLAFLTSMSSVSFASEGGWFAKWKNVSSVRGDIKKNVEFENKADAITGCAIAAGNTVSNKIVSSGEAIADDEDSLAQNDTKKTISNTGDARAYSEPADALNDVTNNDKEVIKETATTKSDREVTINADLRGRGLGRTGLRSSNTDRDGGAATVGGDIKVDVKYENEAKAITGNAFATGNISSNDVCSKDKAFADDGGVADNRGEICVTNNGEAVAYSGKATATNEAQNTVSIDICKNVENCKKTDIFADISATFLPVVSH